MRLVLMVIAAATTLLATETGRAQESFFNKRFCSIPGGSHSGSLLDCSFNTIEQCRASAHGSTRYCAENRDWRPDAAGRRTKARRAARD